MLRVEKFTPKDLPMINRWASDHGLPEMPAEMLPNFGFVVWLDKLPVLAGFVYFTDSSIAFFENFISNFDSNKEERAMATAKLIETCLQIVKDMNYSMIYVRSSIPSLLFKFKEAGFHEISNVSSLMIRRV